MKKTLLIVILSIVLVLGYFFTKTLNPNKEAPIVDLVQSPSFSKNTRTPATKAPPTPDQPMKPSKASPSKDPPRDPDNELLAVEDTQPDSYGKFIRKKIFKTKLAYPLVRVDEERQLSGVSEILLHQKSYIADHLMVKLAPGKSEFELQKIVTQVGAKIRNKVPYSDIYLISFDGLDFNRMNQVSHDLMSSQIVLEPEKDFIVTAF